MKLRTRLFLWVGVIFFVAFGASLLFETYTTDKSLKEAESSLREQILSLNEKHRETMEHYLHVALSEDQALIDSLLLRMSRDPDFGASLFIDVENLKRIAPAHSAFLYKSNKWVNFVQTTKDSDLTSMLIPLEFPMKTAHRIPIDEKISWVVLDTDTEIAKPLIGVHMDSNPRIKESLAVSIDEMIEIDWGLTVLFDPFALATWKKQPITFKVEVQEVNLPAFLDNVEHAVSYIDGKDLQAIKTDIKEKSGGSPFTGKPFDQGVRCLEQEGEVLNTRIIELLQRGDQAVMLGALASLYPGGQFGQTPFAEEAPKGIGRFPKEAKAGHFLLSKEVFLRENSLTIRHISASTQPPKIVKG